MQKIEQLIQADHYNAEHVRQLGETISQRWSQLMFHVEERMKLVMASTNWFKTAEQVRDSLPPWVHSWWVTCVADWECYFLHVLIPGLLGVGEFGT